VWDGLYAAGVDLVVNAHRHFYERQAPQQPDRTAHDAATHQAPLTCGVESSPNSLAA
jgi:hypothetical protein